MCRSLGIYYMLARRESQFAYNKRTENVSRSRCFVDSCTQLLHWQLSLKMRSDGSVQRDACMYTYRSHIFGLNNHLAY